MSDDAESLTRMEVAYVAGELLRDRRARLGEERS